MQKLFIVFILLTFSTFSWAEELSKSFTEMTLTELQHVDTATLDKKAKKSHKKALSAAQKAEKKRLRAEAKAEKARLRAEKKHLKAEAAAKRKQEKAAAKKLKKVNKYYKNTTIKKDEFTTNYEVDGPLISPQGDWDNLFFNIFVGPKKALGAVIEPADMKVTLALLVNVEKKVEGINVFRLELSNKSIADYAHKRNIWPNYNSALLKGAKTRTVETFKRVVGDCTIEKCVFNESFFVQLELNDIRLSVQNRSDLAIRVSGNNTNNLVLNIPFAYMVGFIDRFSEIDTRYQDLKQVATDARNFILNASTTRAR